MRYIRNFLSFWYHFVVGDDWRVAAGVTIGLSIVAFFVHVKHLDIWWVLPVFVIALTTISLWDAAKKD
jgi:hypothetical protein